MIKKLFLTLCLLFVTSHAIAGAMRAPRFKTPSVGHMTKQPGYQARRAANGDYRVSYDAKQPVGAAANDPSFAANVAYDLAKGKVVDTIVNGAKKGKITPAQVAAGVIGTLLLDELIDAGLEWMEEQKQWQPKPEIAGTFEIGCPSVTRGGYSAMRSAAIQCLYGATGDNRALTQTTFYKQYSNGSIEFRFNGYSAHANRVSTTSPASPPATDAEIDAAASKVADTADPNQLIEEVTKIDQIEIMGNEQQTAIITNPEVWGEVTDGNTTITVNPDGTTTTTTRTNQDRWVASPSTQVTPALDPSINVNKDTITTETTTTKNPDGSVGPSTTTTTTSPQANPNSNPQEPEDYGEPTDTPFGEIPKFWEAKYPEGIKGVWNANKPTPDNTAFLQAIKSMFPSFGGGSCPSWNLSFNISKNMNYGSGSISIPCDILRICGLIILATAAFTSRKIIFG
jgi:hypothetical protein